MQAAIVRRPQRRPAPALPSGEVILDPPPTNPEPDSKNWTRMLMFLPIVAGTAAMGLLIGAEQGGPLRYIAGGMYGISVLGMLGATVFTQTGGKSKREMISARRAYMRHLSQQRAQVRETIHAQREAMDYRHPAPAALLSTTASARLWERRPGDWDFAVVRIGLGPQQLATPLVPPQTRPVDELEPLCASVLRRFVTTYSVVPDLPVAVSLRGFSHIYLRGEQDAVRALARAMIAQYVTFHAPEDALVAFCVSEPGREAWEWTKWLPHAVHPTRGDAVGQLRLVAPTVTALEAMLDDVTASRSRFSPDARVAPGRHLIVVIDQGDTGGSDHLMTSGGTEGTTVLDLSTEPPRLLDPSVLVLHVASDGSLSSTTAEGEDTIGRADALGLPTATGLARQLTPLRLSPASHTDQPLAKEAKLAELLSIDDPYALDVLRSWAPRPNRNRLRVPIGVSPDGRPVELDLKESAQNGMGPHGLLVGATGSGKSELLRTLVLALAVTHSPEVLNFVLVDFKGGATFATFDRLPHTSAVITNLADQLSLVDRMRDALQGELVRRQELLRDTGNYASQRDYERARAAGVPLAPLPTLLIICDEFSELLTTRPDFIEMFVQIGRVGRSLGVHLLLASQRLEEGRLRGLETHLSYRIALRTFSSVESRTVLGVPDAYELPRSPGHGYLKTGTEALSRFRAAYVSAPYRPVYGGSQPDLLLGDPVREYSTRYVTPPTVETPAHAPTEEAGELVETLAGVLVSRLEGRGPLAHQVWLPPLDEPLTLDQMLSPISTDPQRGLCAGGAELRGALLGVVGVTDRPFEQRRDLLRLDLAGAAGSLAVAGGPRSGKSTVLRTLIGSLVLTHTPLEVQFYCLDFGGGSLAAFRNLPHVGGVATRRDLDQVRRTVAEVHSLLDERERAFAEGGIDGMAHFRRLRQQSQAYGPLGDVFLVIDGWQTLRAEFEDLEPVVTDIATRGLGYGIHLIATCNRWLDMRAATRDAVASRLELRLGDPSDSAIQRRLAITVPNGRPGRGLTTDGLHFLTGLPRLDGVSDPSDLAEGVTKFVQAVQAEWTHGSAPRVRQLPAELPYEALPAARTDTRPGIPIGIVETDLRPTYLDFTADPHFLVFGDVESGKSGFLRTVARGLTSRHDPAAARIIVVDYRRSLLGSVTGDHLIGYGSSAETTEALVDQVVTAMRGRLPGPDVTPDQLRNLSWWQGPDLYLLVDDYDLVATATGNPLAPLVPFLTQGRDVGLHVVLTRRSGGAARALFDPLIARLRDLASPGLLLSGPSEEGALLGSTRPRMLLPGRGQLVTRRDGTRLIQLAWLPPEES